MIVTLDQKTKYAHQERYEFQNYALHKLIMIVLHFYCTGSVWL